MSSKFLIAALVVLAVITNTAYANKLDAKWSSTRGQINQLGDAAKAGDEQALQQLETMAASGDPVAMHNMGWLYDNGFQAQPGRQGACDWYRQAAALEYPPSMHGSALCLFAKSAGPRAEDEFEAQAMQMMFDSAVLGWTSSSIHLAEYILNLALLAPVDADFAIGVIAFGLDSNPTHDQKVSLSYLRGMAVLFGSEDQYYKGAHDALIFADENGHAYAGDSIAGLHVKWARWQIVAMAAWSPPDITGMDCYRATLATAKDKRDAALDCGRLDREKEDELDRLMSEAKSLRSEVAGEDRAKLEFAIEDLKARSQVFLTESEELTNTFFQNLME